MATLATDDSLTGTRFGNVIEQMARFVMATCDYSRSDRLCPAHYQVFATNPMSVAFGAAGVALFLGRAQGDVPPEFRTWMLNQPLGNDTYAPGLFIGLAGAAYAFAELQELDKAEEVMRMAYASPLLYDAPGMYQGVAGWGWASLYFWDRTGRQDYLDKAAQAADHLLRIAETDEETLFWNNPADDRTHYGYGYGASGISLFLLGTGIRTRTSRYVSAAEAALAYDLKHKLDTHNGITWQRYKDDPINYPYFIHGASGVGTVVIRFAERLHSAAYRAVVEEIGRGIDIKWSIFPALSDGLSGLGEFSLDLHRLTGEQTYLERARDQAKTVLWFQIPSEEGIAFPGRMLARISNDLATGGAGIGLFLHRVENGGPRILVDLPADGVHS